MAQAPEVQVIGLRAMARDVKKMGSAGGPLLAAMRRAGLVAVEPVAAAVRGALPHVTGTLAGDVRATATRTGAGVRMGRSSIRYAGWVEFGGNRKTPHPSFRSFDPRGRYMFPAALPLAPRAAELYAEAVNHALESFDWTNITADGQAVHD